MLNRYHKQLGFPEADKNRVFHFILKLNSLKWSFSSHAIQQLNERHDNIEAVGIFLKELKLDYADFFEYYKEDNQIIKVVFRIRFNSDKHIILVLNQDKKIITLYFNKIADNHFTLNPKNYQTV